MASGSIAEWSQTLFESPELFDLLNDSEERIRRAYRELLRGHCADWNVLNITARCEPGDFGPVTIGDVPFYSICGHHMLPYFGRAKVTYWPGRIVTGIGKIVRLVDLLARRMVIQEALTRDIAEELMRQIAPQAVRVETSALHMCMISRGPRAEKSETTVVTLLGDGDLLGGLDVVRA